MFTQRNNKAKCFQDCIVEKNKTETWMAWGLGETTGGWRGAGRGVPFGLWVGVNGSGPAQETSNLPPCPVPLCFQKRNVKCLGSVETDACVARIWFWVDENGFKGKRLKLTLHANATLIPRENVWHYNCRAITGRPTCSRKRWDHLIL